MIVSSPELLRRPYQASNDPVIRIHEVPLGKGVLRRCEPIILFPYPSACGEYLDVAFTDVDMTLTFSLTEDLRDGIESMLRMKWNRYAMGNPGKMTLRAQKLREHLLAMYRYEFAT